jgi:hypothetical protein
MMDEGELIQEKLNEYLLLLAPLERAEKDLDIARKMLRAKTEEDINRIAPSLGLVSETLNISTIDLLLAEDRPKFLNEALARSGLTVEEVRNILIPQIDRAREELKIIGIPDSI